MKQRTKISAILIVLLMITMSVVVTAVTLALPKSPTLSVANAIITTSDIIEGRIFEDPNANGIKDPEEAPLAGWQINLIGKDTVTNITMSLITTTDSKGHYNFLVPIGNYTISEVLQSGWIQTAPLSITYNVKITRNGLDVSGRNFGNFHKGKIVGGRSNIRRTFGITRPTFRITGDWPPGLCNAYPSGNCLAKGNIKYRDNSKNLNIKSIQINTVATSLDKRKGTITGLAKINDAGSYPFIIYVEDDLQNEIFDISLPTYPYKNEVILNSGEIQFLK